MDQIDYEIFDLRAAPNSLEKEMLPSQTRPHLEFRSLARSVFSHMRAVFKEDIPRDQKLAKMAQHFYRKCYEPPQISEYDTGKVVDIEAYIEEIVKGFSDGQRNHISYLVGRVGTGKTAFLNYLITSRFPDIWDKSKFWFIRFDLEDDGGREIFIKEEELVLSFCRKLSRIALAHGFFAHSAINPIGELDVLVTQLDSAVRRSKKSPQDLEWAKAISDILSQIEHQLAAVIRGIYEISHRKLLVIFDNIDYILHVNDRVICRDHDDTTMDVIQLEDLRRFVQRFERSGVLRELNSTILIVTREDSYRIMRQAWSISVQPEQMSCFYIQAPEWKIVLEARRKLMDWAVDEIDHDGKREQFNDILDTIREDTERPDADNIPLIDRLVKLGNCGFRQVVDFLSLYPFIGQNAAYEFGDVSRRFLHHAPVAQIAFCLGKKILFSQVHSLFPNIYLVHVTPTEADDARPREEVEQVRHSYWLKRLLLEAIKQKPYWLPSKLRAIFAGAGGYDDKLVRECIGSLHDARAAWLIYAEREKHPDQTKTDLRISKIGLTERANYCLDENVKFFDKFYYLQLVVDDYLMLFPSTVIQHFEFDESHNYGYLISPQDQYVKSAFGMIRTKAKQVVVFLECLEAYWQIEQIRFAGAFRLLRENGVVLPEIRKIKEDVWIEIGNLNNYHDKKLLGELKYIKQLASDARESINLQFKKYTPALVRSLKQS